MKHLHGKGFTLVELLIVVAIIGIMSSVIVGALNTARGKAGNAAIKSDLNNVRSQAELIYDQNNGIYGVGLCGDAKVRAGLDDAGIKSSGNAASAVCFSDNYSWIAQSPLKVPDSSGNTYWCVDNGGVARGETVALTALGTCP